MLWAPLLPAPRLQLQLCRCYSSTPEAVLAELVSHSLHPAARPQRRRRWQRGSSHRLRLTAICLPSELDESPTSACSGDGERKRWDVVALGNLCVDIVVPMEKLPPVAEVKSESLLRHLMQRPSAEDTWEVGGNCNILIAAARLGLQVASCGNLGDDIYGRFLRSILQDEGVLHVEPLTPDSFAAELRDTLLCFVLVGPASAHAFCSRYDFGPWPLLPGVATLPPGVLQALRNTRGLLLNGFVFDELAPAVIMAAVQVARDAGAAIFFDPGPRSWTLTRGARRAALDALLDATDVVLMTQEEAEAITGLADPEAACRAVLQRRGAATQWCCVKLGSRGAVLCTRSPDAAFRQHALLVDVQDTVGCGDSFAAAVVLGYIRGHAIPPVMALANAVGAATAMGQGAGRNVATTATVLSLLEREARGAPSLAWVSWDDLDERPAGPALDAAMSLDQTLEPAAQSAPVRARSCDDGAAAGSATDGTPEPARSSGNGQQKRALGSVLEATRAQSNVGSQSMQEGLPHKVRETSGARHGSDHGAAAHEAIALLQESLLRAASARD